MSSITIDKQRFFDCHDSFLFRERSLRERNAQTEKVVTFVMHLLGMIAVTVGIAHAITPILTGKILYGLGYTLVFLAGYAIAYENGMNEGQHREAARSLGIFNELDPKAVREFTSDRGWLIGNFAV